MDGLTEAISQTAAIMNGQQQQSTEQAAAPAAQPAPETSTQTAEATSPLDVLPNLNEEEGGETQQQESAPEQPESEQQPQRAKWGELKKKATQLDEILPEYEQLKQRLQELEQSPPLPEEIKGELEDLRQWKYAMEVESTPEFHQAVVQPMNEQINLLRDVATWAGVDAEALIAATDSVNRFERNQAIEDVLRQSETREINAGVLDEAFQAARKLHEVYQQSAELRARAKEMNQTLNNQRSLQSEKQRQEMEQKFEKAAESVRETFALKMPELMQDPKLKEALTKAKLAVDDPMQAAYQAQAGVVLPQIAKALLEAKKEVAALKKSLQARAGTSTTPSTTNSPAPKASEMTLAEAIRASQSYMPR
jgi:hypothetical protein